MTYAENTAWRRQFQYMELQWSVGDVIRKLREQRGWGQKTLAAKAGISQASIGRMEDSKGDPKRSSLEAVARAFDMTVGGLYDLIPTHARETQRAASATTSTSAGGGFHTTPRPDGGPERRFKNDGPPKEGERRKASA